MKKLIVLSLVILFAVFQITTAQRREPKPKVATLIQSDSHWEVKCPDAPQPIGPYSQAIIVANSIYVSGQIALDTATGKIIEGDIKAETKLIMKYIRAILREKGWDYKDIVKTTIYLTDLSNFAAVNEEYGSYFKGTFPARETVQVAALPKGAHIEISVIASR